MAAATLAREVARLRTRAGRLSPEAVDLLASLRQDPARILSRARMTPDPWQAELLRCPSTRTLLLCSRQSGKSLTSAALALRAALLRPGSLVLLLSPSLRQSSELFRDKILRLYDALGRPVPPKRPRDSALHLDLTNGSRVVSLPATEGTIRGYSGAALLVIDEAARVPDDLYRSVRPMLAVSGGGLVGLSTPFGKRGWFYSEWTGTAPWRRVTITASECPRIPAEFLAEERAALGERWYRQEYECSFEETVDAVFAEADILAAVGADLLPLYPTVPAEAS
jgi:hypothetical protein